MTVGERFIVVTNWLFMVQFSKEPSPQHGMRDLPISQLRDSGQRKTLIHESNLIWIWGVFSGILTSQHQLYLLLILPIDTWILSLFFLLSKLQPRIAFSLIWKNVKIVRIGKHSFFFILVYLCWKCKGNIKWKMDSFLEDLGFSSSIINLSVSAGAHIFVGLLVPFMRPAVVYSNSGWIFFFALISLCQVIGGKMNFMKNFCNWTAWAESLKKAPFFAHECTVAN